MNVIRNSDEPTRTERNREMRRRRFLDAAGRLVARDGLDSLTVPLLAAELDCAVGTLYRTFPSKGALMAELQRDAVEQVLAGFRQVRRHIEDRRAELVADDDAAALLLVALADYALGASVTLPEQVNLLQLLVGDPRGIVPDDEAHRAGPATLELFTEVVGLFDDATRSGALAPGRADVRTVVYLTSVLAILQTRKLARFDAELFATPPLVRETAATLLRGWGAPDELLDRCHRWIDDLDVVAVTAVATGRSDTTATA